MTPRLQAVPPPEERHETEELPVPPPLPWYGERGVQFLAVGLCVMSAVLILSWCG